MGTFALAYVYFPMRADLWEIVSKRYKNIGGIRLMKNNSEVIIETEEYMDVCVGVCKWVDKNGVPVQRHDGNLDSRNDCVVAHDDCTTAYGLGGVFRGVSIISRWVGGGVDMTPRQALSLLAWLRQEEEQLEAMVKEQETSE